MHIPEVMAVEREQDFSISLQELVAVKNLESGEHCLYTPPPKSGRKETHGWMAPMKPVRRNVLKLVREGKGEMRVMRDSVLMSKKGSMVDDYVVFTGSPLMSFPTLDMMANDADDVYNMAQTGKAKLVDEGNQFLEDTLRFCPNFERRLEEDFIVTCKRRVDFSGLHPFILPAVVRH